MFTFSDQEYRWCPECRGNVRKDAYCCKFCHARIGSKLLQEKQPKNVAGFITEAARWLPSFTALVELLPQGLRARIDEADKNTPAVPYVGTSQEVDPEEYRKRMRDAEICAPNPPTAPMMGFVWDVLISLNAEGRSLTAICGDPRLQLLEINPGEIIAESELRAQEIMSGNKCKHCAECIQASDEPCRFCGGTAENPPVSKDAMKILLSDISRFDESLLRNVLLWEAATRRINVEAPLEDEILSRHRITPDEIDRQILILKKKPDLMPSSRWRQRMTDLGITPGYYDSQFGHDFDHYVLEDLSMLGDALTPNHNHRECASAEEALIVFEHALNRWQNNRHFAQQKHRLLNGKSMVYLHFKDNEKYDSLRRESEKSLLESVPESMRDMMTKNIDAIKNPRNKALRSEDPEQRLQALEDMEKELLESQSQRLNQINQALPGLGDALKGVSGITGTIMKISKHTLKGQSALKKNDPDTACSEFESAIALLGDSAFDVGRRVNLYLELANAQLAKGDKKAAGECFDKAFSDAANILEAEDDATPSWQAHHRFACFLRDTGECTSAEEHFNKASSFYSQTMDRMAEKGWLPATASRVSWHMREDYLKLLQLMGRDTEAKLVEEEIAALKEREEEKKKDKP
jgi:tetratricopeptide (TPR) repeat protein